MADLWYYAEDGQQLGPFSMAELLPLLADIPDPWRVMVWRHGSADWKPVAEVREIAEQLHRSPQDPAAPPVATPADPAVPLEPEMTGITGWLALLAIGQVLGIMRLVYNFGQSVQSIPDRLWTNFSTVIWSEMLISAALIGLALWTALLLFRHSRRFPAFFIMQMICAVLAPYVDLLCVASFFSAALARPFGEFFVVEARQIGQTIIGAVSAAVWITYVLRSRRVAATFTK